MTTLPFWLVLALAPVGASTRAADLSQSTQIPETKAQREARMAWWREARFGMFIHWGPVSLKETEISWSRANSNPKCPNKGPIPVAVYDNLYRQFNPSEFDARAWVALAREAGMKYMVLTAKHCDGFLLWDSKVDDYNIMHTPFRRDVCAELVGPHARPTCASAGIFRRWTGATRIFAQSETRCSCSACKVRSANC